MIIDMQSLIELFDGDRDAARQVLVIFFESASKQLKEIREGIANENRNQVQHAAHQLAGATATCGMVELSHRFRELESCSASAALEVLSAGVSATSDILREAERESLSLFSEKNS